MVAGTSSNVFINEIHYDNDGGDQDELIEIANPTLIDLTGWTVLLYNGSNGTVYGSFTLSGSSQLTALSISDFGVSGIQNGSPDGVALINASGDVVQFLSYEGTFAATDGAANGETSTDIGVSENSSTLLGTSLQLEGTGNTAGDFTWAASATATAGAVNNNQTLTQPIVTVLDEGFETDGSGSRYTFSSGEGTDGFNDFFTRTDGSNISTSYEVTGQGGSFFFAAQDTDSVPGLSTDDEQSIFFTGLDINGLDNLLLSIDLAEDDSGDGNEDWDADDFFQVYASIDGGAQFLIFAVASDGIGTGSGFNGAPLVDTDLDGVGDGTEITNVFQNFTAAIAGTGSTLDLEIRFHLDSGDEDLAIDNISVTNGGATPPTPQPGEFSVNDIQQVEGDSGTTNFEFTVTRSGGSDGEVTVDFVATQRGGIDNISFGPSPFGDIPFFGTGTVTFADGQTTATAIIPVNGDTEIEPNETFAITLQNPTGGATIADGEGVGTILNDDFPPQGPAEVFINEIHYDNSGGDVGEGIEIAGPAGTDLTGWSLVLYNGNGGVTYDTENLSGIIPDQDDGFGTLNFPISGIQNGSPDGVALVNPAGDVVQFLSYEGTIEATNGPAAGLTSEDIGVSEGGVPIGTSLQLGGTGNVYDDFTWQPSQTDTFGAVNTGQDFAAANPNGALYIDDASVAEGDSGTATMTFNVFRVGGSTGSVSADFAVVFGSEFSDADASDLSGATTGTITFADGETFKTITIDVVGDTVGEPDEFFDVVLSNPTGGATIGDGTAEGTIENDDPLVLSIGEIQGAGHSSLFEGNEVTTSGIVTAIATNGFYLQSSAAQADGDAATSDGIFVFTSSAPTVAVGDAIDITGEVTEFQPGGDPANLTITQISNPSSINVTSSGNALPAAVVIGPNGIAPPSEVIEDDDFTSFDPATDGIDFWESLEGMLVTIENPVAVDSTNGFGELWTVASDGAGNLQGSNISDEGLVVIDGGAGDLGEFDAGAGSDFNPERVQFDEAGELNGTARPIPDVTPGTLLNDVTGVVDYAFENFQVRPTTDVTVAQASTNVAEATTLVPGAVNQLSVATYNVLNFDINEADGDTDIADGRLTGIATDIGINLAAPDIVVLQEVQDDSGSANDGTVSAALTLQAIADEIFNQTGVVYSVLDNPFVVDGDTGGQPGGNIRVAFLYRDDRVDLDPASVFTITEPGTTDLDAAFAGGRAPLGADFTFNGETVTVIGNHFRSKIGSDSSFSAIQPPTNAGAATRAAQAAAVNRVVDDLIAADADAKIVVAGDFNEFQFEEPMQVLTGELDFDGATVSPGSEEVLENLTFALDEDERFSVLFQGNAQALDHILATENIADGAQIDAVNTNTPLGNPNSDHDPILALFNVGTQDIDGVNFRDDDLDGNDGNDDIDGKRGDDTIDGNGGDDNLTGDRGEDTINGGEGDDNIDGGPDDDILNGDEGEDTIEGGNGADMIDGGDDNDKLTGGKGNDDIQGGDGDDMLNGGNGDDTLRGGEGEDMLFGEAQRDKLFGDAGDDQLDGGAREDELDGGTGMDTLTGGTQADLFILHADQTAADADTITDFEFGIDSIRIDGTTGRTITFVQSGANVEILSDGTLVATVLNSDAGEVESSSDFPGAGLTLVGDRSDNTLTGGANDDLILGNRGMDTIDGAGGMDTINGGPDADMILGGAGDDDINGGDGADIINGGLDNDTILGGKGNDSIEGDQGNDRLEGENGDDLLMGGDGEDTLLGGPQDDTLLGGADNDNLDGGASEDELDGGTGMDMLTGGTQADLFILHADQTAADADTITDFQSNSDTIRIDGAGGKAILFTQNGVDTDITSDGVLVATVLNATAGDVEGRTTFSTPPASSGIGSPPVTTTALPATMALLSDVMDAPFEFAGAGPQPISSTSQFSQSRVSLSDLFETPGIDPVEFQLMRRNEEDEDGNPWLDTGTGFEFLI